MLGASDTTRAAGARRGLTVRPASSTNAAAPPPSAPPVSRPRLQEMQRIAMSHTPPQERADQFLPAERIGGGLCPPKTAPDEQDPGSALVVPRGVRGGPSEAPHVKTI